LPEIIPTHFNFSGVANSWGSRGTLLFPPIIEIVLFLLLFTISKFPHTFNYLINITEENAPRQYRNARTLMGWITVCVTVIFSYIEWSIIQTARYKSSGLDIWFLPVFFIIMFGLIGIYIYRMVKMK
jgi:uncharacterized membrane protein